MPENFLVRRLCPAMLDGASPVKIFSSFSLNAATNVHEMMP